MNKLDRFRFGNYHKRRIIWLLVVTASVFFIALILLALLGIFSYRSELPSIRVSSNTNGKYFDGIGINLDAIPTSNRITESSFDRTNNYQTLTVSDCNDEYLFFDTNSGLNSDNVVVGSEIRVFSLDNDGVMSLRYSGLVNSFEMARFGPSLPIDDENGYWVNDSVVDVKTISGTVVALTENGKLLLDITSDDFVKEFENESDTDVSFKQICTYGSSIYALAENGTLYSSTDGRNFSLFYSNSDNIDGITRIAGVGNTVVFITESGEYYIVSGTSAYSIDVPFEIDDGTILVSSSEELVVATDDGEVYSSSNGYVFSRVQDEIGLFANNESFLDYKSVGSKFYFLTSDGHFITLNLDEINTSNSVDVSAIEPQMLEITETGSVIFITSDNKACISDDNGNISDLRFGSGVIDAVYSGVGDRLIMKSGNNLYYVTVLSAIQVNSNIPTDLVSSGDMCYICTSNSNSFSSDNWFISSDNTSVSLFNDTSSIVTNSSARVLGVGDGIHSISYPLAGDAVSTLKNNSFYRISLKLRSDLEAINNVKVWISGNEFGEEGFVINEVSSNSQEYSYVFALTGEKPLLENDKLYLNISFEDDGVLFVDDVYLGEDRYSIDSIPTEFSSEIISSNPAAIRLNNLNFLSSDYSNELFYGVGPDSLEGSLSLVKNANSEPWFVVGSYADSASIDCFLNYLCGSVSSDYGKLRIDHGTAIPWSRQFETIYIEIVDSDGAYLSDMQRGAYVSYVKSLFSQSSFYLDIKDRIVFLDGMNYEGGIVLSSADYHASSATINISDNASIESCYQEINYNVPRMPLLGMDVGEYISSLSLEGEYNNSNIGLIASTLIRDSASFSRMLMLDIDISDSLLAIEENNVFDSQMVLDILKVTSNLSFMNDCYGVYYDVIAPLDVESEQSAEEFVNNCSIAFVQRNNVQYLTVTNLSDAQQQFTLDGIVGDNPHLLRYSSDGTVILDRNYRRSDLRFTLQPGEMLVVSIEN